MMKNESDMADEIRRLQNELADAAKNWLAMDGLWFLAVEEAYGLDAAMACDIKVWEEFSVIEARRITARLNLPEHGGLDALDRALGARLFAQINTCIISRPDHYTLELFMVTCRTQDARHRKGLPFFPCKQIGLVDYPSFASTIDPDIRTECISCPPDEPVGDFRCGWRFTINKD
nr:DUF6125 family protein [uncultured Methanospirillum sp.]